jgi:valyl-tRNA synthetase
VREKVEKRIRKDYPGGIPAVGADALRFTFAALATYGRTINFDLKRADGYKNFCNKLWNAARFVLMNSEGFSVAAGKPLAPQTDAEKWILTRFERALDEVERQMPLYRFDLVAQALYEFTWNEFCDWFVELAKPALNGTDEAAVNSTRHTLLHVLEALLRALHPIIPFITEEIWHEVAPKLGIAGDSVSLRPYPQSSDYSHCVDGVAEQGIEWLRDVLTQVRRIRSEMNISPSKQIPLLFIGGTTLQRELATKFKPQVEFLARAMAILYEPSDPEPPTSAIGIVGEMKLLIPIGGLIDKDAEIVRLAKEIKRIDAEIAKCRGKLGNANFVANAPADVVDQENQRLRDFETTLSGLRQQADRLAAL